MTRTSQWFLYTVHDALYRPHEVWRHRWDPSSEDVRVLVEPDERFDLSLRASRSEDVVLILSESRDTGETWVVDARPGARHGPWAAAAAGCSTGPSTSEVRTTATPVTCCW